MAKEAFLKGWYLSWKMDNKAQLHTELGKECSENQHMQSYRLYMANNGAS